MSFRTNKKTFIINDVFDFAVKKCFLQNKQNFIIDKDYLEPQIYIITLGLFNLIVKTDYISGHKWYRFVPTYYVRDFGFSFFMDSLYNKLFVPTITHYLIKLLIIFSYFEQDYDRVANIATTYYRSMTKTNELYNITMHKNYTVNDVINRYLINTPRMEEIVKNFNDLYLPEFLFETFVFSYNEGIVTNTNLDVSSTILNHAVEPNKKILKKYNEKRNDYIVENVGKGKYDFPKQIYIEEKKQENNVSMYEGILNFIKEHKYATLVILVAFVINNILYFTGLLDYLNNKLNSLY